MFSNYIGKPHNSCADLFANNYQNVIIYLFIEVERDRRLVIQYTTTCDRTPHLLKNMLKN